MWVKYAVLGGIGLFFVWGIWTYGNYRESECQKEVIVQEKETIKKEYIYVDQTKDKNIKKAWTTSSSDKRKWLFDNYLIK